MARKKITQYTAADALDGTELFEVVQGGANKKATGDQVAALAAESMYTSDGTIDDAVRTVTLPTDGVLNIGTDTDNMVQIGDNSGMYLSLFSGGSDVASILPSGNATFIGEVSGLAPVQPEDAGFTVTAVSRTIFTNEGATSGIQAQLANQTIGTTYAFLNVTPDYNLWITAATGLVLRFYDAGQGQYFDLSIDSATYINLAEAGMSCSVVKISATVWAVTGNWGGVYYAD